MLSEAVAADSVQPPVLSFERVSKSYQGQAILHTLDLELQRAAVTAIVGPSGCGKSTLLKLCNGLVRPESGRVSVFGKAIDYAELASLRRRIGYAVQGTGLFPHMSAGENISLAAELGGWSREEIEARLRELFSLMHLNESLLTRYPHQLSGGQQQRVGLCRALMLRQELLLLDEPFAAIDPITRHDIHRQLLEIIAAEPVSIVLVTHDMREAMMLADDIVLMGEGTILRRSSTKVLRSQYPDLEPEELLLALLEKAAL